MLQRREQSLDAKAALEILAHAERLQAKDEAEIAAVELERVAEQKGISPRYVRQALAAREAEDAPSAVPVVVAVCLFAAAFFVAVNAFMRLSGGSGPHPSVMYALITAVILGATLAARRRSILLIPPLVFLGAGIATLANFAFGLIFHTINESGWWIGQNLLVLVSCGLAALGYVASLPFFPKLPRTDR